MYLLSYSEDINPPSFFSLLFPSFSPFYFTSFFSSFCPTISEYFSFPYFLSFTPFFPTPFCLSVYSVLWGSLNQSACFYYSAYSTFEHQHWHLSTGQSQAKFTLKKRHLLKKKFIALFRPLWEKKVFQEEGKEWQTACIYNTALEKWIKQTQQVLRLHVME